MSRKSVHLYRLAKDQQGVTIIEFALISPVFMFMLMGTFDIGYAVYMRSTLNGSIQLAARDSSLQDATDPVARAAIDTAVTDIIQTVNKDATVTINRTNYQAYADIDRLEDYIDNNLNGTCDNNEPYDDSNANDVWDEISGAAGIGGARDSVLYTITVSYDTLFPFGGYARNASKTKVDRYVIRTRNKYVTTPGEQRVIKLPIYENATIVVDSMIRIPVYKVTITNVGTRKLAKYQNKYVPIPGVREGNIEVPVFRIVKTGDKTIKVPITEFVEVPRKGKQTGEVEMPIYEYVVATRNTGKTIVEYEDVKLPVYTNVITQTDRGPTLRRVLVRYETIRRAKLDTKRKVVTGTRDYLQRKLIGYQTVSKPEVVLARKLKGYRTFTIPTYTRQQIGTEMVPRPTMTIKRVLVGYTKQNVQKRERVLVGFQEVNFSNEKLQRKLTGYKDVVKQMPPTKTFVGTEEYRVRIHNEDNEQVDASFQLSRISNRRTMTAQTLLKNQPYGDQTARTTSPRNCT
jgi:Flp pilus assembly protein TadG